MYECSEKLNKVLEGSFIFVRDTLSTYQIVIDNPEMAVLNFYDEIEGRPICFGFTILWDKWQVKLFCKNVFFPFFLEAPQEMKDSDCVDLALLEADIKDIAPVQAAIDKLNEELPLGEFDVTIGLEEEFTFRKLNNEAMEAEEFDYDEVCCVRYLINEKYFLDEEIQELMFTMFEKGMNECNYAYQKLKPLLD